MNDKQLRTFVTLADCGSFAKAEEILLTSRQALKKQMDALEAEANAELFTRGVRGCALTPAGRVFYDGARQMLALREHMLASVDSSKGQTLRVGAMEGGAPRLLLSIVAAFASERPNCQVKIIGLPPTELARACLEGEVDVYSGTLRPGGENGLRYVNLGTVAGHCLMARNHPLALLDKVDLVALDGQVVGVLKREAYASLIGALQARSGGARVVEIPGDAYAISNFCYAGNVAVFNRSIAEEFNQAFSVVPLDFDCAVRYGFVRRTVSDPLVDDFLSVALRVFNNRHAPQQARG